MTALNLGIQESGNPEIWDQTKIQKVRILKIKIHVAQNVGKVWISRKKHLPASLRPFQDTFSMDRKHQKNVEFLHVFLGGPMGPIHPVLGHLVISKIVKKTKWTQRMVKDATDDQGRNGCLQMQLLARAGDADG